MRVQGGTSGLIAAILSGRLDPSTGRDARDYRRKAARRRSNADWRKLKRRLSLRLRFGP